MSGRKSIFFGALAASLLLCAAEDKGKAGVDPGKISLPNGPGSIEGLGSAFEPQLNSGTASYSVSIAVPKGVAGLQPEVTLSYNSGSGNSPFGIAWNYEPMSIKRQTSKGFPTYSTSDVFVLGGEELVLLSDGSYRKENEGDFMRVKRSGDGWEVRDKKGTCYLLGKTEKSRVRRTESGAFDETFSWFVEEVVDVHGNRMQYKYATFDDSPGAIYLSEIRWSIFGSNYHAVQFVYETRPDAFSSFISGFEVTTARRCKRIRVLSRDALVRRYELEYEVTDGLEGASPQGLSSAFSLLRKVTQYDYRSESETSYLPPLRLGYTQFTAAQGGRKAMSSPMPYSLGNANVALADVNCDALPDFLYTDPISGRHTVYYNAGNGRIEDAVAYSWHPSGVTLDLTGVQLLDVDGDGRVDLVQKAGDERGHFVWYPNATSSVGNDDSAPCWGAEKSFARPYLPFDLDATDVRSLDLNGDRRMDYMRTTTAGFVYYLNDGTGGWTEDGIHLFGEKQMGDITYADDVSFSTADGERNRNVELADMNGDGLLDLVRWNLFGDTIEVVFWPNKGNGAWGNCTPMTCGASLGSISEDNLYLFDINGDGLSDIVVVDFDRLIYWINLGNRTYSAALEVENLPEYVAGRTVLRQADMNGNGSTDFVWENWDETTGGWKIEYYDFIGDVKPNLLCAIDNGLGVRTDIEYAPTTAFYLKAKNGGTPWRTRLPFASTVVTKITKNYGIDSDGVSGTDALVRELAYFDGYYDTFEREFRGFSFAKEVERGDERHPSLITRTAYHTGVSDGVDNDQDGTIDEKNEVGGYEEEPMKGKPLWQETTLLTKDFDGIDNDGDGWIDEDDEGEPSGETASDAIVFTRTLTDWRIKTIHSPSGGFTYVDATGQEKPAYSLAQSTKDGKYVSYAYPFEKKVWHFEANGKLSQGDWRMERRNPVMTRTETEVDFFGNTLWVRDYGEDTGSTYKDETFTRTDYAFNLDAWLIGYPVLETVTDAEGHFGSATRRYYDGTDYWGLGLGKLGSKGNLMLVEKAVNGADEVPSFPEASDRIGDPRKRKNCWQPVERNRYDAYGNVIATADGEWKSGVAGHERQFAYDDVFHTYVVSESVVVDAGRTFTSTATYDYGSGVTLSTTDCNGYTSLAKYDSFFHPVAIIRPGDSSSLPTQTYDYRLADPIRKLYYQYASDGRLTLAATSDKYILQRKGVHQREAALKRSTYDTYTFTDGAGREFGAAEEGAKTGQWIFKNVQRYTLRGKPSVAYQPFFANSLVFNFPNTTTAQTDSYYDAMGRSTRMVNPPERANDLSNRSESRTYYLPFGTIVYDAEDMRSDSPFYGTPTITKTDSRKLVLSTTEILKEGLTKKQVAVTTAYDVQKNVVRLTDAQGNVKIQRHDGLGRKIFEFDPDKGQTLVTFDGNGNPISVIDNKGQEIRHTYDGAGRVLSELWMFGKVAITNVAYHYDSASADHPDFTNLAGALASVEDASGAEFFSYDARGRSIASVKRVRYPTTGQMLDYRLQRTYDSMDRVKALTLPDGDCVTFTYDAHSKVCAMPNLVTNVVYTASEQLDVIAYANGVTTKYLYDPRLRLSRLTTSGTIATNWVDYAYTYDTMSNIQSIDDLREGKFAAISSDYKTPTDTQLFEYDSLYRLTRYRLSDAQSHLMNLGTIDYRYDLIGNMVSKATPSAGSIGAIEHRRAGFQIANIGKMVSGGTAGTSNRGGRKATNAPGPHALTSTGDGRVIDYDANGNAVSLEGMTLTWDFNNRLTAAENDSFRAEYSYDHTGRRVSKSVIGKNDSVTNCVTIYPDKTFELRDGNIPTKYAVGGVSRQARFAKMLNPSETCHQWVTLKKGWNFIGLQIDPQGKAFAEMLGDAGDIVSIAKFDAASKKYVDVSPSDTVLPNVAYMIQSTASRIVDVAGRFVGSSAVALKAEEQAVAFGRALALQQILPQLDAKSVWTVGGINDDGSVRWNVWRAATSSAAKTLKTFATAATTTSADIAFKPETAALLTLNTSATVDLDKATPEAIRYYHQNHLGSTVCVTAMNGSLVESTYYYPYGYPRATFGKSDLSGDYAFIGKEQDTETSLVYDAARYLASHLGRFVSVDPLGTDGGMNVYGYSECQSISFRDTTGLEREEVNPCSNPIEVSISYCNYTPFLRNAYGVARGLLQNSVSDLVRDFLDVAYAFSVKGVEKDYYKSYKTLQMSLVRNPSALRLRELRNNDIAYQRNLKLLSSLPAMAKGAQYVGYVCDATEIWRARDKSRATARVVGGLAGGWAGAKTGAMLGMCFGPEGVAVGAAIGGVVGGAIGTARGRWAGEWYYDYFSDRD